jgi:acetyl-CoA synthase
VSKLICSSAIQGAAVWVARAEAKLGEAIRAKGEDCKIAFPDTAYHLPVIYSFTGAKVKILADLKGILARARALLPAPPSEKVWLPYLGNTLDAGVATLFSFEIIEACKYIIGPDPADGIWLGAANDVIMRERGLEFVDGTAPGFAAITGAAPTNKIAVKIARELQEKNIYVFMAGSTNGKQFAEQLAEEGVAMGWETRLVPFGRDVSALIYPMGFANRSALSFGNVKPGDFHANLKYNKTRIFAFVLAFGEVDAEKYAAAAGALNYGFPVIADTDIPQILPTGICTYEHVVSNVPYETMVDKALEVRGCKVRISRVPIPVSYGPAFEGERIRKQDTRVEFGGNITPAFEFVTMMDMDAVEDGRIDIIGQDVDEVPEGSALPLAIWVEVAGRKMQVDFEAILERQIHHLINGAEGIWHMGQRDIVWTRISKSGYEKGLRLRHYGEILHAKLLGNYPAIVDKVKVTLITDKDEVEKRLAVARSTYIERNRRLESMTDESVDIFYSCLLCQSFAPNHVCVVTPERVGLCGAYNWLDARAAYEIDDTGPNQPIRKGACFDRVKGVWQGVDEYVYLNSHKTVDSICAYSIMDRPMTSCGCFEVICAYIPECNGIMAVNREYMEDTPAGMTFSTLAGSVGGGQQTPGFMGCGKVFLTSHKFLFAEGGHKRLIWMTRDLKKALADDLNRRFEEQGAPDLLSKIPDETIAIDPKDIRAHLEKVNHPAIDMGDIASYAKQQEGSLEIKVADTAVKEAAVEVRVRECPPDLVEQLKAELIGQITDQIRRGLTTERVTSLKCLPVRKEACRQGVCEVTLGATGSQGGTRGRILKIGGDTAMPFHFWEGTMPNRPLVAMEVCDRVDAKYPEILRSLWGDLIRDPAAMAKACVEKHGADLICVRLEGTHPEKSNASPEEAVAVVKSVLEAVDVPLIIVGHSHFDRNNEVMKKVAQACEGENLLLSWVEQDNYRTIAGAALAYGHTIVAQSPIDVNIAKQVSILLTNMNIPLEKIVIDPVTSSIGYGIEYTYSVMERIRLTGLGGDRMLAFPMIVSPGQECSKIKEFKAAEAEFPAWGDLNRRAALWEFSTATSLLYAGASILIMYHPEAAAALKKTITDLMQGR